MVRVSQPLILRKMHLLVTLALVVTVPWDMPEQVAEARVVDKPVLRNYPHCGELGRESSKECFWDCDWQPVPENVPSGFPQYVNNTECLSDCPAIKQCLALAQPVYDSLVTSGETYITVYWNEVYYPYYDCLSDAAGTDGIIEDSINFLIYDSCITAYYYIHDYFPCIDEFLTKTSADIVFTGRVDSELVTRQDIVRRLRNTTVNTNRLTGSAAGSFRNNPNTTLHQYPWLCSLKTR